MKRYITAKRTSPTLDAILFYVYRNDNLSKKIGRYSQNVIQGLIDLGLLKKVISKRKGTFFFVTEKSKGFKAIDLAKEFLWAFHNSTDRVEKENKKLIHCFDKEIPNGNGLVEIGTAIKKCYV